MTSHRLRPRKHGFLGHRHALQNGGNGHAEEPEGDAQPPELEREGGGGGDAANEAP
jgi:hypothetical protein